MRFKTYVGSHTELPHLMEEARSELGPEAVIKTEYYTVGGFFGIGSRKMVKVTAGVEDSPGESPFSVLRGDRPTPPATPIVTPAYAPRPLNGTNGRTASVPPPAPVAEPDALPSVIEAPVAEPELAPSPVEVNFLPADDEDFDPFPAPEPLIEATLSPEPAPVAPPVHEDPLMAVLAELRALRNEVDALKSRPQVVETPVEMLPFSPLIADAYRAMVDHELSPQLARQLAGEAEAQLSESEKSSYERVVTAVCDRIVEHCTARPVPATGAITAPRVLMLIGPTGVGKTTTLAKLAAAFALLDDQAVALVTADTFRIAATEQLRTFAQIINLPLEVVFDGREFAKALAAHGHQDIVLVDTAGRSPRDEAKHAELKRLLEVDHPVETLLVVAATTKATDLRLILDRFRTFGLEGLIITKLDETEAIGSVLELLWEAQLPVRYLTNGQNVPDDLIRGDAATLTRTLAELLFRESAFR